MGFHRCEYCEQQGETPELSSGDVTLNFSSGRSYEVPDMITHYVEAHGFLPPAEFIDDVLKSKLQSGSRAQTKSLAIKVGYLHGDFPKGSVGWEFMLKLRQHLEQAGHDGQREQTRGM
jgi:hypothetical protein